MANNSINFRGEINEMSASYFIREVETLPARSSASIYLHTPGGDIYAGGEMVNAIRAAMKRGCRFTVEIGSLCASMGASLLAAARAAGCRAVAHSNSEVMFHGCWSILVGGADELTDQAKAMRDFNECVKRDLARCGIADTDEWFAADRQKWLNAKELLELGLVDSVLESECDDPEDLKDCAVKIAAKLNHKENEMEEETIKAEETPVAETPAEEQKAEAVVQPVEETKAEEAKPAEETPAEPVVEDDIEKRVQDLANRRFAGLQAKHDGMINDLRNELEGLKAGLATANAERDQLVKDLEQRDASLAELRDQLAVKSSDLEKAEERLREYVGSALNPGEESAPFDYDTAIAVAKTPEERVAVATKALSLKR